VDFQLTAVVQPAQAASTPPTGQVVQLEQNQAQINDATYAGIVTLAVNIQPGSATLEEIQVFWGAITTASGGGEPATPPAGDEQTISLQPLPTFPIVLTHQYPRTTGQVYKVVVSTFESPSGQSVAQFETTVWAAGLTLTPPQIGVTQGPQYYMAGSAYIWNVNVSVFICPTAWNSSIASISWDWGDGTNFSLVGTAIQPAANGITTLNEGHQYGQDKTTYNITISAVDSYGTQATIQVPVVLPVPVLKPGQVTRSGAALAIDQVLAKLKNVKLPPG
jgi:hypothetical protein